MKKQLMLAAAAFTLALPATAQDAEPEGAPSPNQIVDAAPASEWVSIPADDLLVMTLAPDSEGNERKVIIQLMPAPFSQGWVDNIRTFARAKWYDEITVNRVQDNYVVQWGDPNYDNPEAEGEAKSLPEGLKVMDEGDYATRGLFTQEVAKANGIAWQTLAYFFLRNAMNAADGEIEIPAGFEDAVESANIEGLEEPILPDVSDRYADISSHLLGWPIASNMGLQSEVQSKSPIFWPIHCYGMIGVGRGYSPDAGSGAELYTVIGHAPRHLDRNIALVGRIVEGMEHLSSLPRGSGTLGFYTKEEFGKRAPILSVRVASDLPDAEKPAFEYLSTEGETFAQYADARANRRDPFFIVPAGGADVCNIPVPVRRVTSETE